jgi:hypothetical protein
MHTCVLKLIDIHSGVLRVSDKMWPYSGAIDIRMSILKLKS